MQAFVRELGLATFPTYERGAKLLDLAGSLSRYEGTIPRLGPLSLLELQLVLGRIETRRRRIDTRAPHVSPGAARDDATTLASWARTRIRWRKVRALLEASTRVIFGAEMDEIPLLRFLFYAQAGGGLMPLVEIRDGAQETRFVDGAQSLSLRLASGSPTVCGPALRSARSRCVAQAWWSSTREDRSRANGRSWRSRRCSREIAFDPPLPPRRRHLRDRAFVGSTIKCLARYERPLWRERGLSGEVVSDRGPIVVAFDNVAGEQPALLGFLGRRAGARARLALARRAARGGARSVRPLVR